MQVQTAQEKGYTGSPKNFHLIHFYELHGKYFDLMSKAGTGETDIDSATAAIATTITDPKKRNEIWEGYVNKKRDKNVGLIGASVWAVGEMMDYFVETMEILESATGGFG